MSKIPKIIHQISLSLDSNLIQIEEKWKTLNPSWQYKLWTMESVQLLFQKNEFINEIWNRLIFEKQKMDMLAFLILFYEGGVYVNSKATPTQDLNVLLEKYSDYDFLIGQYRNPDKYLAAIVNVKLIVDIFFIASIPNHLFIQYYFEESKKRFEVISLSSNQYKYIQLTTGARILSDLVRIYLKPLKLAIIPWKYVQHYHNKNNETFITLPFFENDNNDTSNNNNTLIIILITVFVIFVMVLVLLVALSVVIAKLKSKEKTVIQEKRNETEKEIRT